jgi:ubiquinone/menaquinone biosynthesis C-methylase UbiE
MKKHEEYIKMQKSFYDDVRISSKDIVGNYDWHENFPYETFLLYRNGDLRFPLLKNLDGKVALDFGCGPGRMVGRMSRMFMRVDGVDISERLISEAAQTFPNSNFWVSSGDNLGAAPTNGYDFVYSTIAIHHIAVHSVRMNILQEMSKVLKPEGCVTLQLLFNKHYPLIKPVIQETTFNHQIDIFARDNQHARWDENRLNAVVTNGSCDVAIGNKDLFKVRADFERFFDKVSFWFYDTSLVYANLNGTTHGPCWATHWLFVNGYKM